MLKLTGSGEEHLRWQGFKGVGTEPLFRTPTTPSATSLENSCTLP